MSSSLHNMHALFCPTVCLQKHHNDPDIHHLSYTHTRANPAVSSPAYPPSGGHGQHFSTVPHEDALTSDVVGFTTRLAFKAGDRGELIVSLLEHIESEYCGCWWLIDHTTTLIRSRPRSRGDGR